MISKRTIKRPQKTYLVDLCPRVAECRQSAAFQGTVDIDIYYMYVCDRNLELTKDSNWIH
jgi:hypothetical protein